MPPSFFALAFDNGIGRLFLKGLNRPIRNYFTLLILL
ncbi:hypothetical protein NEOC95_002360 [Neochlamydia sp. AcF95]|nr:hypothetical protein [Neochlamydia sp. AcF95]